MVFSILIANEAKSDNKQADWQRTIRFFAQLLEFNENLEGIIKDIQNDRG